MITLERLSTVPVLQPKQEHPWEAGAVFNTGAISHAGLIHLIYRATDIASDGSQGPYINNLGYATSPDGLHFERQDEPILTNDVPQEARGPEDPRIVRLEGAFTMLYTGYGGRFGGDYRICRATSLDLVHWERQGVVLDEENKDASLFPEKVKGVYILIHRRAPDMWLAFSNDIKDWKKHTTLMSPVPDSDWESEKIGLAGPPLKTEQGWLIFYHGVGGQPRRYSLGIALLDLMDPTRVLARQPQPILTPELSWEKEGNVNNVVFSCGQAVMGDDIFVYYGGADTVIGAAAMRMSDIDMIGD
ncbi:MAG: glycosidase [Anaerolineales bacterium]